MPRGAIAGRVPAYGSKTLVASVVGAAGDVELGGVWRDSDVVGEVEAVDVTLENDVAGDVEVVGSVVVDPAMPSRRQPATRMSRRTAPVKTWPAREHRVTVKHKR